MPCIKGITLLPADCLERDCEMHLAMSGNKLAERTPGNSLLEHFNPVSRHTWKSWHSAT